MRSIFDDIEFRFQPSSRSRLKIGIVGMFFEIFSMFVPNGFCSLALFHADTRQNVNVRRNSRISAQPSDTKQNPLIRALELSQRTCQMPINYEPKVKTEARYREL